MGSRPSSFTLTSKGPQRLYSTAELIRMPPPRWQIEGIMPDGGLVGLYAPPGVGKTFLAIDMAMCVASGQPWQGHAVEKGQVLYISAEGGTGIGKRVWAWLVDRGLDADKADVAWQVEAIPIHEGSDGMDILLNRVGELPTTPSLIVIDTLARCFDGDENTQEDMGRFVKGVDLLRTTFESTVLIVHHTRLDGNRERGNTAFRGAADCMMRMEREEGVLTLSCTKQKDSEEFQPIPLGLKVIAQADSCVLDVAPGVRDKEGKTVIALASLRLSGPMTFNEWAQQLEGQMSKATLQRVFVTLKETSQIVKENGKWVVKSVSDENE